MKARRVHHLAAGAVVLAAHAACVPASEIRAQADGIATKVETDRIPARQCAPKNLAYAETHLMLTYQELAEGRFVPANDAVLVAAENWVEATAILDKKGRANCMPLQVAVNTGPDPCDQDDDKDSLGNCQDKCPQAFGPVDNAGCPWGDADGDGIADNLDQCPQVPGPKENLGCPFKDTDGDGIDDKNDKCPNEPWPEPPGCPPVFKTIEIKEDKIELKQQIFFETGKAVIRPISFPLLKEVAEALKAFPGKTFRIEGHTDDVGSDAYNKKLSQARAESVRKHLVTKEGADGDRLIAVGYGEERPIASNRTAAGKAKNRRVEFNVVQPGDAN